ncbi:MAG: interleukin-like EMT inducer domain-containing protein [Ardenticatenia bacterium]|nr:interleukin-like EMT inducer domain-containing protein [Ardenticatenia bacterium]
MPIFKANRYPSRYSVLIAACLAVLSAYGMRALAERYDHRRRCAILSVSLFIFLVETAAVPLPLSSYQVPAVYETLAQKTTTAVLEVPMAWRNGFRVTGPLDTTFMFAQFYQTVHRKRLLNGNTSRNPEFLFQYFTEAPLLNSLLALETGKSLPEGRERFDAQNGLDVLQLLGVRQIIVHRSTTPRPGVTPEATIPYLEQVLPLTKWYDDGRIGAWEVALPPPPRAVRFDALHPLARLHFGDGWGPLPPFELERQLQPDQAPTVWAQRRTARLFVALDAGRVRLRFRACSPVPQQMHVAVNGKPPVSVALRPGWHEYALVLEGFQPGPNTLRLSFERLVSVTDRSFISTCVGARPGGVVSVVVESAGLEVGDLAHIYVNGRDVAPNLMGYNVAVLDPATGEVIRTAVFDPVNEPTDASALAQFIREVPENALVAVAANDTVDLPPQFGGPKLTAEAVEALRLLGSQADLRGTFRWSHALLSTQGSSQHSTLEDVSPVRPARVWLGELLTAPRVAAGFAWFELIVEPYHSFDSRAADAVE